MEQCLRHRVSVTGPQVRESRRRSPGLRSTRCCYSSFIYFSTRNELKLVGPPSPPPTTTTASGSSPTAFCPPPSQPPSLLPGSPSSRHQDGAERGRPAATLTHLRHHDVDEQQAALQHAPHPARAQVHAAALQLGGHPPGLPAHAIGESAPPGEEGGKFGRRFTSVVQIRGEEHRWDGEDG